jgi:ferrous iron transport protein A
MKNLKDVKPGETVQIVKIGGGDPSSKGNVVPSGNLVKRRIMEMGITKGVEVYVRKVAPLGDPIEITVRGYELSLRKADAELIEVE